MTWCCPWVGLEADDTTKNYRPKAKVERAGGLINKSVLFILNILLTRGQYKIWK
jgi:hypothetical protein